MTYQELYDELGKLTPEQRQQEACFQCEDVTGPVSEVFVAQEDYINPSGDGAEPKSAYDNPEGLELLDGPLEAQKVVIKAGEVFLVGYPK